VAHQTCWLNALAVTQAVTHGVFHYIGCVSRSLHSDRIVVSFASTLSVRQTRSLNASDLQAQPDESSTKLLSGKACMLVQLNRIASCIMHDEPPALSAYYAAYVSD
jgi:hypothetical protein